MAVLDFGASGKYIDFTLPAGLDITGAFTIAYVVKRDGDGTWDCLSSHFTGPTASPANTYMFAPELSNSNRLNIEIISTGSSFGGDSSENGGGGGTVFTVNAVDGWDICIISKAAGSGNRFRFAVSKNGGAFSFTNSALTAGNPDSQRPGAVDGVIRIGRLVNQTGDDGNFRMAVMAILVGTQLSDANQTALIGGSYTTWGSVFTEILELTSSSTITGRKSVTSEIGRTGSPTLVTGDDPPVGVYTLGAGLSSGATVTPPAAQGVGDVPSPTVSAGAIVTSPVAVGVGDVPTLVKPTSIPVNSVLPVMTTSGDPTFAVAYPGDVLTLTSGTWSESPSGYTYVFRQSDVPTTVQSGASNTYTIVAGDVGHDISGRVVATNAAGDSSAAVAVDLAPSSGRVSPTPIVVGPLAGTGDVPSPVVTGGTAGTVTAPPATGTGDVVTPAVSAGANVTAPPAAGTGTLPPTNSIISAEVGTGPLIGTGGLLVPVVSASAAGTVVAPPVDGVGDLPDPGVSASSSIVSPVVDGIGSEPIPGVSAGATETSPVVDGDGDVPSPGITADAGVVTPVSDGTGDIPTPGLSASASVAPTPARGAGDLFSPSVSGGRILPRIDLPTRVVLDPMITTATVYNPDVTSIIDGAITTHVLSNYAPSVALDPQIDSVILDGQPSGVLIDA